MRYCFLALILIVSCKPQQAEKEVENYPVLETMGYYQRFSQKLWLAGQNQNWELADFYTHELEEVTEKLVEGNVIHDDYNISNLTEAMLLPKIEKVEEAIRKKDQVLFLENYKLMISSCNLCHNATKHNFIKILVPNDSTIWNQDFTSK
ncbi:hypothetical protein [Ekhidna sp.]|uniref:hypothetical protein n=1 Tax=Ekhidna sp. TaxID=2608089 RepID=UPI003297D4A6